MRRDLVWLGVAAAAFVAGWWLGGGAETLPDEPSSSRASRSAEQRVLDDSDGPLSREPSSPAARASRPRAERPAADDAPAPGDAVVADDGDVRRPRLRTGRITLLSRSKHGSYESATFSFEHARRDDPGLSRTNNDWELIYGNGPGDPFSVRLVTDDRSTIADLGAGTLEDVAAGRLPAAMPTGAGVNAEAVVGHVYLVHSLDGGSDHFSVFQVVSLVTGDRVTFDWADLEAAAADAEEAPPIASAVRGGIAERLLGAGLASADVRRGEIGDIADAADVVLQLRTGAQGGNKSHVTLGDPARGQRVEAAAEAFDVTAPRGDTREKARAWTTKGLVPRDRAFVVEAIDVYAAAAGDGNGHGEVVVRVAGAQVFQIENDPGPYQVWFAGRAVIRPGRESDVDVGASNSSAVEVRLHGRFVPLAEADKLSPVPFEPAAAPADTKRAGGSSVVAQRWMMEGPQARIVLACGSVGGNGIRASLLGADPGWRPKIAAEPFALEVPPRTGPTVVAHAPVSRIPKGKTFVITSVTWSGFARGDSNGPGKAVIRIGSSTLLDAKQSPDPLSGGWSGRVVVPAGREGDVVVEISNASALDVRFDGAFEDAASGGR